MRVRLVSPLRRPSAAMALAVLVVLGSGAGMSEAPGVGGAGVPMTVGHRTVGRIAFAGVRWGKTSVSSSIYLIGADGKSLRQLTAVRNVEDVDPVWSPEGGRIAFGRYARGWRLYTMDPADGRVRAITATLSLARAPTWSPDGRQLAFEWMPLHPPSNYAQQVAVVNADGGGLRILTSYGRFRGGTGHPAWSPDGKTIIFSARSSFLEGARTDVWSVRADGRGARRLVANADAAAWSPDGGRVAFSRRGDLCTVTSAGTALRRLTRGYYADSLEPSWSPDGKQIAFSVAFYDKSKQQTSQSIMVVNADGTNRREITKRDPDFWATSPSWQPGPPRAPSVARLRTQAALLPVA